ncbi:MAG: hypothetical protein JXK05_07640 [Campylobacterales bacterium]|nr:hypothetical protein [Campylobacterales bacterium]
MNTSYDLSAYRSRELNIEMRTSSGDVINLDFANRKQLEFSADRNQNSSQANFAFSSLEAYRFSVESNGIDEQDKQEIAAFMEIAQPYIDRFMKEVSDEAQTTPMDKIAQMVEGAFEGLSSRTQNVQNQAKNDLVGLFDESLKAFEQTEKLFSESQKLLEKILRDLERGDAEKLLYA